MGVTLSAHCGAQFPVGFLSTASVTGFPAATLLGIDLLDLNQNRLALLASGLTTDATGSLSQSVTINEEDGVYTLRVFCDDGTGNPLEGQLEAVVRVAVPCDVLYALTTIADVNSAGPLALEVVDISANPPAKLRTIQVGKRDCIGLAVSPDRQRFYVADVDAKVVLAYDATKDFPDPANPATALPPAQGVAVPGAMQLALSADGKTLYVTGGTGISAINTATMTLLPNTFNTPDQTKTFGIDLSPDGNTLAVTAANSRVLYLLDAKTLAVKQTVTFTPSPMFPSGGALTQPTFTDATVNRLLLADVCFDVVYQFDVSPLTQTPPNPAGVAQVPNATIALPSNPQPPLSSLIFTNKPLYYSAASGKNALMLARPKSTDLNIPLVVITPLNAGVPNQQVVQASLGGFSGTPYAICLKTDPSSETLYVTVSTGPPALPDTLDAFDTRSQQFTQRSVYTFTSATQNVRSTIIQSWQQP